MTYAVKYRQKVLPLRVRGGLTIQQVATRFDVGVATVVCWLKRSEPKQTRDKPATKIDMDALRKDVADHQGDF